MAQSPTAKRVAELIKGPVENAGYMLWDVRFVKEGASWYLRVFIDKDAQVPRCALLYETHVPQHVAGVFDRTFYQLCDPFCGR